MASQENLKQLKDNGYDYIVTGKRPSRIAYEKDFQELPFSIVNGRKGKSPVQIAVKDEAEERIVLCYSEKRSEKEKSILSKAEKKYLQDMENLSKRLDAGRLKSLDTAERALGRIQERHPRVNRYYRAKITKNEGCSHLALERLDKEYNNALQLCGGYYLRCSKRDFSAEEIWKIYMMLTRVETGFRTLKSDLGLRPIYHQKEERCESHIFITILAYHLLQWIEYSLKDRGEYMSWISVKRLLQTHAYTTITCPSKDGKVHHIRTPGTPDSAQSRIYNLLNIDINKLPRPKTTL
jgi:transposase